MRNCVIACRLFGQRVSLASLRIVQADFNNGPNEAMPKTDERARCRGQRHRLALQLGGRRAQQAAWPWLARQPDPAIQTASQINLVPFNRACISKIVSVARRCV